MKNVFKFGFFALALSLSVVACNSNKPAEEATDSLAVDTTVVTDSVAVDSVVVDSAAVDTAAAL